jgi:hypothetical protein
MRKLIRYAWADEAHDLAWTVAVIQHFPSERILSAYGGKAAAALGELTFAEATKERNDHFDSYAVLQLLSQHAGVVAIEPNGWTGNLPEIARRSSTPRGRFFSVYWSPVALQVLQAENGRITASFDPSFVGLPAGASDLLPGWLGDGDFPLEHLRASCLAAMEQQTGVAFERDWLTIRLPTYRIPDPDEMLKHVASAREL